MVYANAKARPAAETEILVEGYGIPRIIGRMNSYLGVAIFLGELGAKQPVPRA